jgi:hypothetical protein
MKQFLSLFLFLLPCLAWAQYPSNGNQKITLGEQSTADGLIYRGVLNDTFLITPSSDTSAYIILDTVNHRFYNYNRATNVWSVAGGGTAVTTFSAGTTGLTPSTATSGAVTLGGTLAVANGGTNATTLTANKVMVGNGTSGVLTPTKLHWDNTNSTFGIGRTPASNVVLDIEAPKFIGRFNSSTGTNAAYILFANTATNFYMGVDNSTGSDFSSVPNACVFWVGGAVPYIFATSNLERMRITENGEIWMGYTSNQGAFKLQVNGSIYANGTTYPSDERYKENIIPLNKGLDLINKLKPVTFNYINTTENNFSEFEEIGFIAQDVDRALSTESFVKSIVKYTDESNTNSKMVFSPQNLIPILTKAIQEQQALIKALEQRIINLENK